MRPIKYQPSIRSCLSIFYRFNCFSIAKSHSSFSRCYGWKGSANQLRGEGLVGLSSSSSHHPLESSREWSEEKGRIEHGWSRRESSYRRTVLRLFVTTKLNRTLTGQDGKHFIGKTIFLFTCPTAVENGQPKLASIRSSRIPWNFPSNDRSLKQRCVKTIALKRPIFVRHAYTDTRYTFTYIDTYVDT